MTSRHATFSRHVFFALVMSLALVLTACGSDTSDTEPPAASDVTEPATDTTAPAADEEPDEVVDEGFTPERPLPADFPVFPGAVMWHYISSGDLHHYLYSNTTGTAEEIVEFFGTSFRELGLQVTTEFSIFEEFGVAAVIPGVDDITVAASVYYLDDSSELDDITPTTPGRSYAVAIDLDAWAAR